MVFGGSGVSFRVGIRCLAVGAPVPVEGRRFGRNRRESAYLLTRWSSSYSGGGSLR